MGGLSRKRMQPRIVRKVKPKSAKQINVQRFQDKSVREKWDQKKTVKQNFANLGLSYKVNPSMRHSETGQKIREGKKDAGEKPPLKQDFNELFKGVFKEEKDIVRGPSVAKLRGDDLIIMRRLVKKHSDDVEAMFRDIKVNYMQWSKSELKIKIKALESYEYKDMDKQD